MLDGTANFMKDRYELVEFAATSSNGSLFGLATHAYSIFYSRQVFVPASKDSQFLSSIILLLLFKSFQIWSKLFSNPVHYCHRLA